ncbi:MAG: efflux RND transporter permease subunit [Xanthobacteraceae bacterium]|nr:efflux RND transporter permease subunit [Xanthobacteraceae bacterium]
MSFSELFIRRPIGTALLAIGLFLTGVVAYGFLPVASMPSIEFPTIRVSASRPGADPAVMAATMAAPLERRLGEIPGVTEITSRSSLGSSSITIQFDLNRSIDGAARDVQAALNAAATDLPGDLPTLPAMRKVNPSASPVMILALTSPTLQPSTLYDVADTLIAQRIAQIDGVAEVTVNGAEQPAMRIRVNPVAIALMGVSAEDVRAAISNANSMTALGTFEGPDLAHTIGTNDQIRAVRDYQNVVVKAANGTVVRIGDIATVEQGVRNNRSAAWFNAAPSVLLVITKAADANVIDTVDRVREMLPELKRWIPADIDISILSDRTTTIRASVLDMQFTLAATIALVMMVVFLFLRRLAATVAAGVTVPLALAGTCALMWVAGFSINNISLMALAVSVGFVVDDAIVVIENVFRNLEKGMSPMRAAIEGARQISFTVLSISLSLVAAFMPLLFIGGLVGRLFSEFSLTMAFAIGVSTVVSLTLTPMVCAHFVKAPPSPNATWFDRGVERALNRSVAFYASTLDVVLRHRWLTLLVFMLTIALTCVLYVKTPKGFFPQDDTGLIFGGTRAAPDISFEAMKDLQQRATQIVLSDPAVAYVGSSVGASSWNASVNNGQLFISLKPPRERGNVSSQQVINRLRPKLLDVGGMRVFMFAAQDVRSGGRQSSSSYQYTLWSADYDELLRQVPRVVDKVQTLPELVDVTTDREQNGLQANVVIDRLAASRLGVRIQDINNALNNAFAQRQVSTIYGTRNQYRVILEVDPAFARDPSDLTQVYVDSASNAQVPLSAVARIEKAMAPLVINHQGQFPAVTITFNLAPNVTLEAASAAIDRAVATLHMPDTVRTEFAGDAKAYRRAAGAQPLVILAALLTIYIILGVLYESLAHPLTIISTLPSAGLGALLALQIFRAELTVIAFIGIILLIGLVKKNGIMMVDFALAAERQEGLSPAQAIREACLARFRPIMMTTMAAMLGAVPLIVATGPGSELRRPLGMTIVGGLIVSQVLTLYTTPVIYLLLDRLHHRLGGGRAVQTLRETLRLGRPAPG